MSSIETESEYNVILTELFDGIMPVKSKYIQPAFSFTAAYSPQNIDHRELKAVQSDHSLLNLFCHFGRRVSVTVAHLWDYAEMFPEISFRGLFFKQSIPTAKPLVIFGSVTLTSNI